MRILNKLGCAKRICPQLDQRLHSGISGTTTVFMPTSWSSNTMFCRQQGQPIYPHTICLLYITELNVPCFPIFIQNHASRTQASCNIILRSSKTTLTELYPLDFSISHCYFIESRILQPEPFYMLFWQVLLVCSVWGLNESFKSIKRLCNFSHCEMLSNLHAIACSEFINSLVQHTECLLLLSYIVLWAASQPCLKLRRTQRSFQMNMSTRALCYHIELVTVRFVKTWVIGY